MEIGEIISDALSYPLNNTKALLIYIMLLIVAGIIGLFTGAGIIAGQTFNNALASGAMGIIGLILMLIVYALIEGYGLDVVSFGIDRNDGAPELDFGGQIVKGIKYLIVGFVYLIIPIIIGSLIGAINQSLGAIVTLILLIIFGLALFMGVARLAKTGELGSALNIPEAIKDITAIGIFKVLVVIIIVGIISLIISYIPNIFGGMGTIGAIISIILTAVISAYTFLFSNRSIGLLYSDR